MVLHTVSIILVILKMISAEWGRADMNQDKVIATPLVKIKKCCPGDLTYDNWYNCVENKGISQFFLHKSSSVNYIHLKLPKYLKTDIILRRRKKLVYRSS